MPIPLAIAAPAALAGLAYFNAKTSFGHDLRTVGSGYKAYFQVLSKEKQDRLNCFYTLEEQARGSNANATFLIFDGRRWTYKETYETVLKYGTWLKTKFDIKPKEIVAMDFTNSEKFVFVWFGLWSIGAKPAFINYNLTGKALTHCIKVSDARLCLLDPETRNNAGSDVRGELPSVQFSIFDSEAELEVMATTGLRLPDSARSEDKSQNMGILIYTSGTTGFPKPAVVQWSRLNGSGLMVPGFLSFTKDDVFYTCMPLYHSSASMLGVLMTMFTGGTISIGKKFSTSTFWNDVRSSNATVIQYVGETCRYLLSAPSQLDPKTGENLDKKNTVRMAFGNGLRPDVWNRFKERFDIGTIAEMYSATESASSSWNYSRNDYAKGAIGRTGTLAKLLIGKMWAIVELDWENETPWRDPATGFCKKVASGDPGEMLYKLDETDIEKSFQGYYKNSKATSGKIMRDVFVKGDAYFRTGDVISWEPEGRVYFNDRIGDTFRWKSENVSTNEVSEALGTHPGVREANVYGIELPHHDGRAGCVGLLLNEEPSERLLSSLAEHANKRLPRFAVPLFLRLVKEMETTGTNKQLKHIARAQGVDPVKTGEDQLYWLKGGTYVRFGPKDWEELHGGRVRL